MSGLKTYYYNSQIRNYLIQFLSIFSGLQVKIGKNDRSEDEEKLIPVPIRYGNADRIVQWIKGEFTQNKPIRLPIMSANITGVEMAPELRKGIGVERRNAYLPRSGIIPDDIEVVKQQMPVPYRMTADLAIWSSNQEQRWQILEQILTIFDPILQIQKNDAIFDWTKITTVELTGIATEDNYPITTNRRILVNNLSFSFPIYLSAPANIKKDYVKDIYVRIGAVSQVAETSEDIVAELDAQGIEYELWFEGENVDLGDF